MMFDGGVPRRPTDRSSTYECVCVVSEDDGKKEAAGGFNKKVKTNLYTHTHIRVKNCEG